MEILDVKWKPVNKQFSCLISGHRKYTGTLQVLVDKSIDRDDRIYKHIGNYLYSEKEGFVSVFMHTPGSTDGFAGRSFELNVDGKKRVFKGSLWDPTGYDNTSNLPEYRSISLTEDPEVMKRGHTFWASYVTKELYDELMDRLDREDNSRGGRI